MDEIEAFVEECRRDPWFQSHHEVVDRLESVLTKFYLAGEGPEWQAIWDQVHAILERFADPPEVSICAIRKKRFKGKFLGSPSLCDFRNIGHGSYEPLPPRPNKLRDGHLASA
jgi:hypothetical protein